MESISTSTNDVAFLTSYSIHQETGFNRAITERVVPETEESGKNSNENNLKLGVESNQQVERKNTARLEEAVVAEDREVVHEREDSVQEIKTYYARLAASDYVPSDFANADPLAASSSGVKQASATLQTAISQAVQNGMGIEQACNIRTAKAAYEANLRALKSIIAVSA